MKRLIGIQLCMIFCLEAFSQLPPIDSGCYHHWKRVEFGKISSDGNFVMYRETDSPLGYLVSSVNSDRQSNNVQVICSLRSAWKKRISVPSDCRALFSRDSKYVICSGLRDSLFIVRLETGETEVSRAKDFKLVDGKKVEWLIYRSPDPGSELFVKNMNTGAIIHPGRVKSYVYNGENDRLAVIREEKGKGSIAFINLVDGAEKCVWDGMDASALNFDKDGRQLVFFQPVGSGRIANRIWYYQDGGLEAKVLVNDSVDGVGQGYKLAGLKGFSADGSGVFFTRIHSGSEDKELFGKSPVKIWSFIDTVLLPERERQRRETRTFLAMVKIGSGALVGLEGDNTHVAISYELPSAKGYVLSSTRPQDEAYVRHWNSGFFCDSTFLVSVANGSERLLSSCAVQTYFHLSPLGNYVIYFDNKSKNFFSCNTVTNALGNISKDLPDLKKRAGEPRPGDLNMGGYHLVGWTTDGKSALFSTEDDLYLFDLSGKHSPVNVTNGYGKRNSIQFELFNAGMSALVDISNECVLSAFNHKTKQNGFFRKKLDEADDPEMLSMGSWLYYAPGIVSAISGEVPAKAKDAGRYLVKRMSAEQSPNYFTTTDFKHFDQVTDLYPEKKYNWYKTVLFEWQTPDGTHYQGLLYKPTNFDSTRRYPVIFHYYELVSNQLNVYFPPEASDGGLNIPWYVSHGYLVFCPDIHYKYGEPGPSALKAVESAAKLLSQMPWVDKSRLGLQGISWGGFETNYIATHSTLFAAVCTASGTSDIISHAGEMKAGGISSEQGMVEVGQYRMNTSMWERPDLYIRNASVLSAHKVTAPVLLFHTTIDGAVPFNQAMEMYLALRRLGKRVWLLEYPDGNHGVWGKSAMDFDERMQQFFGHYLIGEPAPEWMLHEFSDKMENGGFDLVKERDPGTGNWVTPKEGGLLTDEERKKVEALEHRGPISLTVQ